MLSLQNNKILTNTVTKHLTCSNLRGWSKRERSLNTSSQLAALLGRLWNQQDMQPCWRK